MALRQRLVEGQTTDVQVEALLAGVHDTRVLRWGAEGEAFVLEIPGAVEADSLLLRLAAQPGVRYVQVNHLYRLDGAKASAAFALDSLGHLEVIGVPRAWQTTEGVPSVRVGVVDSGLWFEHPAFEGQIAINAAEDANGNGRVDPGDFDGTDADGNGYVDDVAGFDFVDRSLVLFPGDYRERDADPSEDAAPGAGRGHGTSVTGVLAARAQGEGTARGVAPGVRIVPMRAFGADGIGEDDDVAAAIIYGADLGVEVLNLSFGDVYHSPLMRDAIAYAHSKGVTVVASAGNDGKVDPHYPSDYPEVISVAWLTEDGTQRIGRAARGVGVDMGAPGSQIYTTLFRPDEDDLFALYGRQSGSSVAAPQVAAAAALLRSLRKDLTPSAIRDILAASARDIESPGWDEGTGAGLLQVDRALALALPARVALESPKMDAGVFRDRVPIVVTALDPAFERLHVEYALGIEEPFEWHPIGSPRDRPAQSDTVAVWETTTLPDTVYTLRLRVARTDGKSVEDRARVTLDRTPPRLLVARIHAGLVDGAWGIVADVETDDRTHAWLVVDEPNATVASDRLARRHGLLWANPSRRAGRRMVTLRVQNASGMVRDTVVAIPVPAWRPDESAYRTTRLVIPAGYQLPTLTDFDNDAQPELVLNEAPEGAVGDTLGFWEWRLDHFVRTHFLIATVLPRSAGDTNADGRAELLTQVQRATLLLQASQPSTFPSQLAFADTTGLGSSPDSLTFAGALLTDLDGDGAGEIAGHNGRSLRLLEHRGNGFAEVARVRSPFGASFAEPDFRVADLNQNGRPELIAVDTEGGVVAIEATANDTYHVAWSVQTPEVSPRSTLAVGDVDGDGVLDLFVFTTNPPGTRADREQEPPFGVLRRFAFVQGVPSEREALRVAAPGNAFASVAAANLDGVGGDEVVFAIAPNLYVLRWSDQAIEVLYHEGDDGSTMPTVVRSPTLTTGDLDADGRADVFASYTDGALHRLQYHGAGIPPAPSWLDVYALSDSTVFLRWRAVSDSAEVFILPEDQGLMRLIVAYSDTLVVAITEPARYAVRAWRGGEVSASTDPRVVVPRAPATLIAITRPLPEVVLIEATRPLAEPEAGSGRSGEALSVSALRVNQTRVRYRFAAPLVEGAAFEVVGLRDTSGAPIATGKLFVPPLERAAETLFIEKARVLDAESVELVFSSALDPETVIANNFTLKPGGKIVDARIQTDTPSVVVVRVSGINVGPTGLNVSIEVRGVRGASGADLDPDGGAVLLARAAEDLAAAFVYPNPVYVSSHSSLTIGGVTEQVEAIVLTPEGLLVRRIGVEQSRGGLEWDLRDSRGALVPSGMYLIRLTATGHDPVLLRAAIIR